MQHYHNLTPGNVRLPVSLNAGPQAAARVGVQGAGQHSRAEQCQRAPPQLVWDLTLSRRCLQQLAVAQAHLNTSAVRNVLQDLYHSLQRPGMTGKGATSCSQAAPLDTAVSAMLHSLNNNLQARSLQDQALPAVILTIEPTLAQRFDECLSGYAPAPPQRRPRSGQQVLQSCCRPHLDGLGLCQHLGGGVRGWGLQDVQVCLQVGLGKSPAYPLAPDNGNLKAAQGLNACICSQEPDCC